ncbi:AAA family ATPase [Solicola gregarius]|uniref:Uncharacterized protein n=1 Tax=Solicola gregarius TaxID=2908642 RepID=A0AA46TFB9_9ACTN|nr:hypothetical protein [Solicola gregarius]UYM04056.1 hypothetical protein L0C25_16090 [Solicola gregarius]
MTLSVLIAAGGASWESDAVHVLEHAATVTHVRRCVDVLDLVATAASGQAHAALLSVDLPGLDTDVVHRLVEARVTPVGFAESGDGPVEARFEAIGVRTCADTGGLDRIDDLVIAATALPESVEPVDAGAFERVDRGTGRMVTVWGPTGAPGRSTVALGLAAESADTGTPTLLVDADTYGGSVAQMLAVLDEVSGILAAARSADTGSLDLADLTRHVRQVGPTLRVLTGMGRADRWPQLRVGSFDRILEVAREMAPVVIVDVGFCLESDEELAYDTTAPRRNAATLRALERSDSVVAVGAADPLGLTRLTRGVHELRDRVPDLDVQIVVNRMRDSLGWGREQIASTIERFTGSVPVAFLPHDQVAVDRAWVDGRTLLEGRDSALRRALGDVASAVLGTAAVRPRAMARRRR